MAEGEGASLGCGKNNIAACRSQGVPLAAESYLNRQSASVTWISRCGFAN